MARSNVFSIELLIELMKEVPTCCPWFVFSFTRFYWWIVVLEARGRIGSYVGLQMVSPLGLLSLYGVLTLQRATLAHLGCVSRAMGLHSSIQHSMYPQRCSDIARDSPIGWWRCTWFTFAQATPQLYHGLDRWPETCMLMCHQLPHHMSPYRWSTGIFDLLEDPWGHFHALTTIGSSTVLLCGEQGANPLSISFGIPTHHFGTYKLHHAS